MYKCRMLPKSKRAILRDICTSAISLQMTPSSTDQHDAFNLIIIKDIDWVAQTSLKFVN